MPDNPRQSCGAQTLHFTPDPELQMTASGDTYAQVQPPLVIPLNNYADFIVTALQKVR